MMVKKSCNKEEIVIFDVSMRIPGSPGTQFTPYSGYLHHDSISYGERIAMEIKKAIEEVFKVKVLKVKFQNLGENGAECHFKWEPNSGSFIPHVVDQIKEEPMPWE